ncbi:hypothetical protein [Flavobacterium sp.]|jgi:hypothetical protein|uniref:hypothetical protein n=1 Tax=Flavobacterium sp. TaxID=239 RepID=UPI0037C06A69
MADERQNFEDVSGFKFYSMGIAVEDIDPDDEKEGKLKVSPMETLNVQKPGFIHHVKDTYTNIHPDEKGKTVTDSITSRNYLVATWRPFFDPNRVTPPTVRKNESVMLFKFGNVEKYYWTTIAHEPHIRRREKARYAWSNVDPGSDGFDPYDKDTSYWIEVDTIKKKITLKTNDNDGEVAAYEIVIDTEDGKIDIKDNKGNKLNWKSVEGELFVDFLTKIHLKAGDEIILDAPTVTIAGRLNLAGGMLAGGDIFSNGNIFGQRVSQAINDNMG